MSLPICYIMQKGAPALIRSSTSVEPVVYLWHFYCASFSRVCRVTDTSLITSSIPRTVLAGHNELCIHSDCGRRCSTLTSTLSDGHRRRGSEARVSQERSRSLLMTHTHQRSERNTNTYSHKWMCWQTKGPRGYVNYLLSWPDEFWVETFLSPCFLRRRPGL